MVVVALATVLVSVSACAVLWGRGAPSAAASAAPIAEAVRQNRTLKTEDAAVLEKLQLVADDNPHVDAQVLSARLATITVDYPNMLEALGADGEYVQATYNSRDNVITHIRRRADVRPLLRAHEAIHVLYARPLIDSSLPTFVAEGGAELIAHEYFDEDPTDIEDYSYVCNVAATKTLFELLGRDTMLRALATDDRSVLTEEMARLYGSEREADRVLMTLLPSPLDFETYGATGASDSLLEPLKPYFDAKYGEGYTEANEILGAYEYNFTEIPRDWPKVYYHRTGLE